MATGACGIDCDVCHLNLKGICSTCGPGTSDSAARKLAAQERIIGHPCLVLACARLNHIDYCLRDCRSFPCENFQSGPYPFSEGYMAMHARRKKERPQIYAPDGSHLEVDAVYWQQVAERDRAALTNFAFFEPVDPDVLQFRFLNEALRIDLSKRCLLRKQASQWEKSDDPLLTLATVMYLKNINAIYPIGKDIVGVKDLKEGHFFAGPHEFRLHPLLKRFANDPKGFRAAAIALDGHAVDMADAGFRLLPFPRVPLYFLLWLGDDEFKPRIQVLFDRPIQSFLAADAIWALVNRVAMAMAQG